MTTSIQGQQPQQAAAAEKPEVTITSTADNVVQSAATRALKDQNTDAQRQEASHAEATQACRTGSIITAQELKQIAQNMNQPTLEKTLADYAKARFETYLDVVGQKHDTEKAASTVSAKIGGAAATFASYASFGIYSPSKPKDLEQPIKNAAFAYLKAAFSRLNTTSSLEGLFRVPGKASEMENLEIDADATLESARVKKVIADHPSIFLNLNPSERIEILTWTLPLFHRIMTNGEAGTLDCFSNRDDLDTFSPKHFAGFLNNLSRSCAGDMYKHLKQVNPEEPQPSTLMNAIGFDYHPDSGALEIDGTENLEKIKDLITAYDRGGEEIKTNVKEMQLAQAWRYAGLQSGVINPPNRYIIALAVNTEKSFKDAIGLT